MDAYVYLRITPGSMPTVLAGLSSKSGVRRAIAVVGDWDVLAHVEGPDLSTIAVQVLSEFHHVQGVQRTFTAPVVPPDRVGIAGWGAPQAPAIIGDACYVHIQAQAGAAGGIAIDHATLAGDKISGKAVGTINPNGASDFALVDINVLVRFRDKQGAPIKAVFVLFNQAPYAIVARKSRGSPRCH